MKLSIDRSFWDRSCRVPISSWHLPIGFALTTSCGALGLILLLLLYLCVKRYLTWRRLRSSGIPTVYWRPRFINYKPSSSQQEAAKMSPSTITNILPRMKRLQGPYDMYGTVYGVDTAVVHVAHPVPALAILSSSSCHASTITRRGSWRLHGSGACKAPAYNHFKTFCGDGVFTADGLDWKQKRAAVTHALLKGGGVSFETKIETEACLAAQKLVQRLRRDAGNNPTTTHNLLPILQRATVGLIFRYITHVDLEEKLYGNSNPHDNTLHSVDDDHSTASTVSSHESEEEKGVDAMKTESQSSSSNNINNQQEGSLAQLFQSYLQSIVQIRMIILAKSRSIWFLLPQWCYRWFSTMAVDEEFTLIPIRKFSTMACQAAVEGSPLGQLQKVPLYQNQSLGNTKNNNSNVFSKNLLDEAITLLFAGQDTSAATLSWTLHLLSLSPRVQNKLAGEVCTVLGQHQVADNNTTLTKRLLSRMPYLDAVIKESMRLYPVAPFVVRRLPSAVTIGGEPKEVTIPADTVACIWIYSLHRHPDFWRQPHDFVPERWLATEDVDAGISNGAYMPFAAGPRNCVGQPLAHMILRTLLCQLVANFEFHDPRLSTEKHIQSLRKDMQAGFTVLPKDGVDLVVRERQKRNATR